MKNPNKLPDNVRQRYAETITQLALGRGNKYTTLMNSFVPVLGNIFEKEEETEALRNTFDALMGMIADAQPSTLEAMQAEKVVDVWIARICVPARPTVLNYALELLTSYVEARGDDCLESIEHVVLPLKRIIVPKGPGEKINKKIAVGALELLLLFCRAGLPQTVQYVLKPESNLVTTLSSFVVGDEDGLVATISLCAAEILLSVALHEKSEETIASLMDRGFYATLFRIVECYEGNNEIAEKALQLLLYYILKVENIAEYQQLEKANEGFDAEESWAVVRDLSTVASGSDEAVRVLAAQLLEIGKQMGLTGKEQ